jgi:hypothetical protein
MNVNENTAPQGQVISQSKDIKYVSISNVNLNKPKFNLTSADTSYMNAYPQSGAATSNQVFYDTIPNDKSINLSKSFFVFKLEFTTQDDEDDVTFTKNLPGLRALNKFTLQINGTKIENTSENLDIISLIRAEDIEESYLNQFEPYMQHKTGSLRTNEDDRTNFELGVFPATATTQSAWFAVPLSMISGFAAATKSLYYIKELRVEVGFKTDLIDSLLYKTTGTEGTTITATTSADRVAGIAIKDSYMLYHQTLFSNSIKTQLAQTPFYYIPFDKYECVLRAGALKQSSDNINLSGTSIKQIKVHARDANNFEYQLQFQQCEFNSSGKFPPQSQSNSANMIQSFAYDRAESMNGLDGANVAANYDGEKTTAAAQRSYTMNIMEQLGYDVPTESSMSGNVSFTMEQDDSTDSYIPAYDNTEDEDVKLYLVRKEQAVVLIDEFGKRVLFTINR